MLKHSFRLVKVVDGCQGYTSVVELATIPEKWINHSQYGRCRIQNCEEVESHCGHGQGCTDAGFNCSGGVCRWVPATRGFTFSYNYSF